jgi:predicted transcriptional regulator
VVEDGAFLGMVDRALLLAQQQGGSAERVSDLFGANVPVVALPGESCRTVATRMAVHGLERLAVVTDARSRRLVGIISRSDLVKPSFDLYAEEQEHETVRQTPLAALKRRFVSVTGAGTH